MPDHSGQLVVARAREKMAMSKQRMLYNFQFINILKYNIFHICCVDYLGMEPNVFALCSHYIFLSNYP
jgi:hypothetical protein